MACVVLGVCGSIAAYKAADVASWLVKQGHEVHAVYQTSGSIAVLDDYLFQTLDLADRFNRHGDKEEGENKFQRLKKLLASREPNEPESAELLAYKATLRQVEALAKQYNEKAEAAADDSQPAPRRLTARDYDILKNHLSSTFHTPVKFSCDAAGKGKITFPFQNEEELEKLISIFDRLKSEDLQNLQ